MYEFDITLDVWKFVEDMKIARAGHYVVPMLSEEDYLTCNTSAPTISTIRTTTSNTGMYHHSGKFRMISKMCPMTYSIVMPTFNKTPTSETDTTTAAATTITTTSTTTSTITTTQSCRMSDWSSCDYFCNSPKVEKRKKTLLSGGKDCPVPYEENCNTNCTGVSQHNNKIKFFLTPQNPLFMVMGKRLVSAARAAALASSSS